MSDKTKLCATVVLMLFAGTSAAAQELKLDESPVGPGEWGYRPAVGTGSAVNPPAFSWRPQGKLTWQLQCSADAQFASDVYNVEHIEFSVHCPGKVFGDGKYYWRYRGKDENGQYSNWSKVRHFTIAADAAHMPMPQRSELIGRIPKTHPRLFTRPEEVGHLRQLAKGKLKGKYDALARQCERLLKTPPATAEPPKYGADIVRGSDPWRKIWWGNRRYVIKALDGAATLGFAYLLDGNAKYGNEARRILMECAKWDPVGSTGYRYNDEAGMPYAYYFSRTYTFINDLLSDEEKTLCRKVMKVRGEEMYKHLCPRHLWRPYGSHANRAWHFLGEVGIAFLDEIDGADDWVWFAMNVFYNVYPVWCDDDGGWHEGAGYWSSYQGRFTWWADIMREAFGIDAFDKPYYSRAGYYAMYLMPPGKVGGGFGDLVAKRTARSNRQIVSIFAAQAQNSHWRWYVDQLGGPVESGGYIGFVRGALPQVEATPPDDLAGSRLFEGIGQAYLNTNITDASESVQVAFKSSPFGTQSHGYEANNSFLLWGYGKRLLIRSGYRDSYGSDHHRNWMWSTRSVNNITVNGKGQYRRASKAIGEITDFKTTPSIDIVVGEAAEAYEVDLERFTRAIIFVKPELVIVYDRLKAKEPSTYEYRLHAINEIDVKDQHNVQVTNDDVLCDIDFLAPAGLSFTQTDQYDPNPRPRITLREWHLTAATVEKKKQMEFVTLYRVHRSKDPIPTYAKLRTIEGGYALQVRTSSGEVSVLLPTDDSADLRAFGLTSKGAIKVRLIHNKCGTETLGLDSPDAGDKSLEPDFPLVDFHVHLKGGLTLDEAVAISKKNGVKFGIAQNCGLGFPVTDDEGLDRFIKSLEGTDVYKGMQAEGREWVTLFSPEAIAKFDYVFTDSMTWTDDKGNRMRLWMPDEVVIDDKQKFMDMLVERIVTLMNDEPIDIYVNSTFLPARIAGEYDALWTKERMQKVIDAAVKNDVAIEINARYKIPGKKFIQLGKKSGCRFSFGTNNTDKNLGNLEYCRQMAKECGLTSEDMFTPKPHDQKPIFTKGLPQK